MIDIRIGDCRQLIHSLTDESVDMVMTSPPYWGLRDYGHPDQIGLEPTPEQYLKTMLDFFDDVKLKLKAEGNCFVNLGDTYSGSGCGTNDYRTEASRSINGIGKNAALYKTGGIAQKLKNDEWELRDDLTKEELQTVLKELSKTLINLEGV